MHTSMIKCFYCTVDTLSASYQQLLKEHNVKEPEKEFTTQKVDLLLGEKQGMLNYLWLMRIMTSDSMLHMAHNNATPSRGSCTYTNNPQKLVPMKFKF